MNDTLQLNGESGNDVVTVHGGITGLASLGVDGGADLDSTHVDGTKAPDTIQVVPNGTLAAVLGPSVSGAVVNSAAEQVVVSGLGGADTIVGSIGLAPITSLVIDGGKNNDTLLGGDGGDFLIGGPGNDFLDGNRG